MKSSSTVDICNGRIMRTMKAAVAFPAFLALGKQSG
jgi:hypothetical protein